MQTVDFDQVSTPVWRTVYENKTTTADGNGLPALVIPGGATAASTVYLWTEDSDIAFLANGSETTYHSLDHEGNPKDYIVYKANIVNQETFPFRIKGGSGKAGQSTTIYLSTTPTNIYNTAGTLVTNVVWQTVAVTNQANPEVLIEILDPSVETTKTSIDCTPAFDTAQARLRITVDAFTNAVTVSLNPTLGVSGPALFSRISAAAGFVTKSSSNGLSRLSHGLPLTVTSDGASPKIGEYMILLPWNLNPAMFPASLARRVTLNLSSGFSDGAFFATLIVNLTGGAFRMVDRLLKYSFS